MDKDLRDIISANLQTNLESKLGDELQCRACPKTFVRGTWCFYQLCDECFRDFDMRKMNGRFGSGTSPRCESVEEFIEQRK